MFATIERSSPSLRAQHMESESAWLRSTLVHNMMISHTVRLLMYANGNGNRRATDAKFLRMASGEKILRRADICGNYSSAAFSFSAFSAMMR